MIRTLLCSLAIGCIACSCASRQEGMAETTPPVDAPDRTVKRITSDTQAMARALLFTKEKQLAWGQPTRLYRTVSKWYAVRFADSPQKRERIVLVNPENGHAELPLRR